MSIRCSVIYLLTCFLLFYCFVLVAKFRPIQSSQSINLIVLTPPPSSMLNEVADRLKIMCQIEDNDPDLGKLSICRYFYYPPDRDWEGGWEGNRKEYGGFWCFAKPFLHAAETQSMQKLFKRWRNESSCKFFIEQLCSETFGSSLQLWCHNIRMEVFFGYFPEPELCTGDSGFEGQCNWWWRDGFLRKLTGWQQQPKGTARWRRKQNHNCWMGCLFKYSLQQESSINATHDSNHTLQKIFEYCDGESDSVEDESQSLIELETLLVLNRDNTKVGAARRKTLDVHFVALSICSLLLTWI